MLQSKMQEQKEILDLYIAQAVSKGLLPAYTRTTHSSLNTQEQLLTISMEETAFSSLNGYEKDLSPILSGS